MNLYNNLPQQTPMYPQYGYNYQRAQMIPSEAPQVTSIAQTMNYIKGRPVVSIDEARASQIDLDGSLYVFPDLGNKKIYTKQINMDGTASFNVFELAAQPVPSAEGQLEYVTKTELEEILTQFKASLGQQKPQEPGPAPVKAQVNKPTFNL